MPVGKTRVFIDGENLVARYQQMLEEGWRVEDGVVHEKDVFVWHPDVTCTGMMEVIRASYYTSVQGDAKRLSEVRDRISDTIYNWRRLFGSQSKTGQGTLYPQVFKRPRGSRRSRQVDIHITIDMMRSACGDAIDAVLLLSGDGDFIPLLDEVGRRDKKVWVAAFSSGLNRDLPHHADEFLCLDSTFLRKE